MASWSARLVGGITAFAMLVTQTAAVAQDAQHAAGAAGQQFGQESIPDPATLFSAEPGGGATLFPGSTGPLDIPLESLFPGAAGPGVPDLQSLFGDEHNAYEQGATRGGELLTEGSPEGEAYRTVLDSREKIGPDLRDDPIFGTTREVLDTLGAAADEFSDCEEQSVFVPGTVTGHVPDYRQCERLALPPEMSCEVTHAITLGASEQAIIPAYGVFELQVIVPYIPINSVVDIDLRAGTFFQDFDGADSEYNKSGTFTPVDFEAVCGDSTSADPVPGLVIGRSAPVGSDFDADDWTMGVTTQQPPSCANGLKARVAVAGGDCKRNDGYLGNCTLVPLAWRYQGATAGMDSWAPQDCVLAAHTALSGSCRPEFEVLEGPAHPGECGMVGGQSVCPGSADYEAISVPPFDPDEATVSRLATRVRVTTNCTLPATVCYEDDDGNQECPPPGQTPITDSCGPLRTNPQCTYVSTAVVEDALDENGNPYIWEDTYDCGYAVSGDTVTRQVGLLCPNAIPGLGNDFIVPPVETNESFAEVAATLEAANMMAMDSECKTDEITGITDCKLFAGDDYSCKKAVGGVVNCCENPSGVSLAQYLQLAFNIRELGGAIGHLDPDSPLLGAWETLAEPIDAAWTELTEPITSAFNSITGSVSAQAGEAAAQGLLSTVEQAMLHQVAEWTTEIFGAGATNMLFSSAGAAAGEGAGALAVDPATGVMAESLQLGGGAAVIGSALTVIMAAYALYQITMVIIQIAWKCKKSEFELGMKKELKSCHYNGTYCADEVLGFCIERRQSYCCFSSPLSRIMQEQLRPLLGRGWGSVKNPDCGPIDVQDFESADWSKVDLSEWMSILIATDMLPTPGSITLDELTGSGRALSAGIAPDPRLVTPDRTRERLQSVPVDDLMDQAKQELLGATPPAP